MKNNFFRCLHTLALAMGLAGIPVALFAQNNTPGLQQQLAAQYPLASALNGCNVGNPETALEIQKAGAGLRVLPATLTIAKCTNRFVDGTLKTPTSTCNGDTVSKLGGIASGLSAWRTGRAQPAIDNQVSKQQLAIVSAGEKVYPVKLEVNEARREIKFAIITCKSSGDQQGPYKGELIFQFKDMLKVENVSTIEDVIAQVFLPGGNQQAQGPQQDQSPQQNQDGQQGQDSQQAPDAQPGQSSTQQQGPSCIPTIGQTPDQVVAACGNPSSQVRGAGTKLIYFYNQPKLKILFIDGKVADID
jgi:hypothetical protein